MKRPVMILMILALAAPAFAVSPADDVPRLWILASDGAVRHRDMVQPAMDSIIAMGTDAVPYLLTYLHTEDARERHAITDIFKGIGSPAVVALTGALGTGDEYHTINTLTALGKIGDSTATSAAIPFLQDDRYAVRSIAAETIGKTGGPGAEAPLLGMLRDGGEIVRKSVVVGLGRLGRPASVDSLLAMLDDPWFGVRYAAAAALASIDSGAVAIGALRNYHGRALALLLNALVDAGIAHAERWASRYLNDPEYIVRAAAARALVRSGDHLEAATKRRSRGGRQEELHPLVRSAMRLDHSHE